jgi:hypothetical protein
MPKSFAAQANKRVGDWPVFDSASLVCRKGWKSPYQPGSNCHVQERNESQDRSLLINPQLVAADWKLSDRSLVRFEIPLDGYDAEPWNGVTDYCLYDHAGSVLAVIEAKRTSRSPREAVRGGHGV